MKNKKSSHNILWIAGDNSKFKKPGGGKAGFWVGLWHGIIAPLMFLIGLFNEDVSMYETENNGRWYDFGFLIGIGAFGGGAKKATG